MQPGSNAWSDETWPPGGADGALTPARLAMLRRDLELALARPSSMLEVQLVFARHGVDLPREACVVPAEEGAVAVDLLVAQCVGEWVLRGRR